MPPKRARGRGRGRAAERGSVRRGPPRGASSTSPVPSSAPEEQAKPKKETDAVAAAANDPVSDVAPAKGEGKATPSSSSKGGEGGMTAAPVDVSAAAVEAAAAAIEERRRSRGSTTGGRGGGKKDAKEEEKGGVGDDAEENEEEKDKVSGGSSRKAEAATATRVMTRRRASPVPPHTHATASATASEEDEGESSDGGGSGGRLAKKARTMAATTKRGKRGSRGRFGRGAGRAGASLDDDEEQAEASLPMATTTDEEEPSKIKGKTKQKKRGRKKKVREEEKDEGREQSKGASAPPQSDGAASAAAVPAPTKTGDGDGEIVRNGEVSMVLLAARRRGLYECDYCRADVSQVPRIRCAVCPDFDLCLDCFATSDHRAVTKTKTASVQAERALAVEEAAEAAAEAASSSAAANAKSSDGAAATMTHCHTHGYRVSDSTRYPLFPSARGVMKKNAGSTNKLLASASSFASFSSVGAPGSRAGSAPASRRSSFADGAKDGEGGEEEDHPHHHGKMASRTPHPVDAPASASLPTTAVQMAETVTATASSSAAIEGAPDRTTAENEESKATASAKEETKKEKEFLTNGKKEEDSEKHDDVVQEVVKDKDVDYKAKKDNDAEAKGDGPQVEGKVDKTKEKQEEAVIGDVVGDGGVQEKEEKQGDDERKKDRKSLDNDGDVTMKDADTAEGDTKEEIGSVEKKSEADGGDVKLDDATDGGGTEPSTGSTGDEDKAADDGKDVTDEVGSGNVGRDETVKPDGTEKTKSDTVEDKKKEVGQPDASSPTDKEVEEKGNETRREMSESGGDAADVRKMDVDGADGLQTEAGDRGLSPEEEASLSAKDSVHPVVDEAQGEKDKTDAEATTTEKAGDGVDGDGGADPSATATDLDAVPLPEPLVLTDDPRTAWTAEEDLRLLEAIKTHGLGNWADISEAVSSGAGAGDGGGSSSAAGGAVIFGGGKSARRCMERYCDDFLGRYGHILPPYTLVEVEDDEEESDGGVSDGRSTSMTPGESDAAAVAGTGERKRKRSRGGGSSLLDGSSSFVLHHSASSGKLSERSTKTKSMTTNPLMSRKRYKVVPTETLPGYDDVWPDPYLPPIPGIQKGDEIQRDLAYRSEMKYYKDVSSAPSKEDAERIRRDWMERRLQQIKGGEARVLPPRLDDVRTMPGSELAGFMPRRGDFDMEWDNDAEQILADMEFSPDDHPQDRQLKLQIIEIYNAKLDERERRKKFLIERKLLNYRANQEADQRLPQDERDLVHRMRLFARFHSPEEHDAFVKDLLKAKRLRKEIAKLQSYRRLGITSLAEAERYELDKTRREFHKVAQKQKEAEEENAEARASKESAGATEVGGGSSGTSFGEGAFGSVSSSSSLWKQYKTSDRKSRKSINRTLSGASAGENDNDIPVSPSGGGGAASMDTKSLGGGGSTSEVKEGPPATFSNDQINTAKAKSVDAAKNERVVLDGSLPPASAASATCKIVNAPGYELLSPKEVRLCERLHLLPRQYLDAKRVLIAESLNAGLLDKEGSGSSKRSIVKIDVEKRNGIIDFIVKAGWVSARPLGGHHEGPRITNSYV